MAYVRGLECDDGDEGSVGRGSGSCRLSSSLEEGGANVFPVTTPTLRFSDNVVMSAVTCFTWDGAPDGAHLPNDRNEEVGAAGDYALRHAHYRPDGQVPVYSNLHAYKCARTGMYYRGEQAHFPSAVFADIGGVGAFFTYNQVLKESALASMSANHDEDERRYHFDPSVDHQRRNGHGRSVGIYIYDGPFVLDNVLFADFSPTQVLYNGRDITPLPMAVVGSAQRFVNVAKQVSFEPEPYLRFNMAHRNNWQDSYGAGVVDLVGDLTGYPGRTIVPMDHEDLRLSMNYYPGCEALTKESALVCDYNMGHLQMHNALAFDIARTDGPAIDHIPSEVGKHLNKIPVIIKEGSGIEYRLTGLTFGPRPSIRVVFNSHLGDISPLVEIASLISAPCSFDRITMNGAQELYSLDQVRKASSTSYAVDATTNSLYFRIKATEQRQNISPESEQGIAIIELQCM